MKVSKHARITARIEAGWGGRFRWDRFVLHFEGMVRLLQGQSLDASGAILKPLAELDMTNAMETVEEGQDYEVVIDFAPHPGFTLEKYYEDLAQIGTSIQVGEGDGIYRMHIHTELGKRYEPISYTETQGVVKKIMMENLQDQMSERQAGEAELTLTPINPARSRLSLFLPVKVYLPFLQVWVSPRLLKADRP